MKKLIILLMVAMVLLSATSSYALGFLNITGTQLTRLDASTFRLRVSYDWGGSILPALLTTTTHQGFPTPTLTAFSITGANTGFNFFSQNAGLVKSGSVLNMKLTSTGNQFGFDFNVNNPLTSSFTFFNAAQIQWIYPTQTPTGSFLTPGVALTENYNGQFTINTDPISVPEPASALLLGLGLAGMVFIKRRK
jgi:hypothetical protein